MPIRTFALAMGGEEPSAVLPEQRPDEVAIGLGQGQGVELSATEEGESSLAVGRGRLNKAGLDLEEEHQPMRLSLITAFGNDAGEVQVRGFQDERSLLVGFPDRAGMG
jgi:hypothetical protein